MNTAHRAVKKVAAPLAWLGVACYLLLGAQGCSRSDSTVAGTSEKVEQEFFDFSTRHVKQNVLQWTLEADSAMFLESDRTLLRTPAAMIYENGKPTVRITSETGEINDGMDELKFMGNVKAVHADVTIYAQEMFWQNEQGEIYVPGDVKMVRGDSVMYGDHLTADPRLKTVECSNPHGEIYPKDEKTYVPIQ